MALEDNARKRLGDVMAEAVKVRSLIHIYCVASRRGMPRNITGDSFENQNSPETPL